MNTWFFICNCNYFDLKEAFANLDSITWPQRKDYTVGDLVYLYATNPYRAVLYSATVEETNIHRMDSKTIKYVSSPMFYDGSQTYVRLRKLNKYSEKVLNDDALKEIGLANLQNSFKLSQEESDLILQKSGQFEEYSVILTTDQASNGCDKIIVLRDGKKISVTCPPGIRDGQTIRIRVNGTLVHIKVCISDNVEYSETKSVVKSKIGRGILGAILGGLLSTAVWIVLFKIGYIAGIAGLISAILVFKGYEYLGKGLDKKGLIASIIVLVVTIYVSVFLGMTISAMSAGGMSLNLADIFTVFLGYNMMFFQGYKDVTRTMLLNLAMAYGFSAWGSFSFIKRVIKNRSVN